MLNVIQLNIRELRHLGCRIQAQVIESLEARAGSQSGCNDVQRSEAAMSLSQICLEYLGGNQPDKALTWLELAASLGHPMAKAVIYRLSKALGCYDEGDNNILSYLIESAEAGIRMAIDDLMEISKDKGEAVLRALEKKRLAQCEFQKPCFTPSQRSDNLGLPEISMHSPLADLLAALTITDEMGDSVLHRAARCGEISVTQRVLQMNDVDIRLLNSRNKFGQTPLLLSCIAGEYSIANILLQADASASIADNVGDTPLHWLHAFEKSDMPSIAASLMERGANIHAYSSRSEEDPFSRKLLAAGTSLHRAAAWNNGDAVRVLLDHGADPLRPNSGHGWNALSTPLWFACTFHSGEAVKAILLHLGKTKNTATLVNDSDSGEWPFLRPVFDMGYYYRSGGMLGRIARHGELYSQITEDTIRALKDHGASMVLPVVPRTPGMSGHPALTSAILLRCSDMVKIMLRISPELIEQRDPRFMQPPLHFAVQQDRTDIAELLLSSGANPHARNGNEINALTNYTSYQSSLEIPRLFLKRGVRFEIPSNGFQTPFFGAVSHSAFELAKFVLENTEPKDRNKMINAACSRGPTFNTTPPGITILGYLLETCHQNLPRVLQWLLRLVHEFGEKLDVIVDLGQRRTAFHVLAEHRPQHRIDSVIAAVAKELLHQPAFKGSINSVSKEGKPALWYAVKYLNYDLFDCLLCAEADPKVADFEGISPLDLLQNLVKHTRESHADTDEGRVAESFVKLLQSRGYALVETA